MKKVVLVFGLISGAISSAMMFLSVPFVKSGALNNKNGEIIGYTAIFLSFLLVFFGIRTYRENAGGAITFGRAFSVGILITLISCVFYVATWEVIYFKLMPDFGDKYAARAIATMREKGATDAAIAAKKKEMEKIRPDLLPVDRCVSRPVERVVDLVEKPLVCGALRRCGATGAVARLRIVEDEPVVGPVSFFSPERRPRFSPGAGSCAVWGSEAPPGSNTT
jgi:hypothetical protein